ncbi:type III secretion inner membrane ring lipoprotein SctJ [Endozoicomonas sp. Mp262]|uniref:type III secretion system inner membrane ring lipoprotein SctJ n=1 Tax=Endozoicomonas sp. Mp262 TaxID=2919499 RepID=UPI0021D8935C
MPTLHAPLFASRIGGRGFFHIRQLCARPVTLLLCAVLLLTGCKSELYSGLSEKEANAMLVLLQKHHISVDKVTVKGGKVTIRVSNSDQAEAISILNRAGFPREQFDTVPGLFPQDTLIKSPLEEQARFTYAKSQELAATLAEIDGVLSARVHLVLPHSENKRNKGNEIDEASASVFIKHNASVEVSGYTPQIKLLVSKAVSSLKYDNISVVFFPSDSAADLAPEKSWNEFLFIRVEKSSSTAFIILILSLIGLILAIPAGFFFWYQRQNRQQDSHG